MESLVGNILLNNISSHKYYNYLHLSNLSTSQFTYKPFSECRVTPRRYIGNNNNIIITLLNFL